MSFPYLLPETRPFCQWNNYKRFMTGSMIWETVSFVSLSEMLNIPLVFAWGNIEGPVEGKQSSLFPVGPAIKCLSYLPIQK